MSFLLIYEYWLFNNSVYSTGNIKALNFNPIPFYYFIESTKLIMHHVIYSGVITFFLSDWDLSRFKGGDVPTKDSFIWSSFIE